MESSVVIYFVSLVCYFVLNYVTITENLDTAHVCSILPMLFHFEF